MLGTYDVPPHRTRPTSKYIGSNHLIWVVSFLQYIHCSSGLLTYAYCSSAVETHIYPNPTSVICVRIAGVARRASGLEVGVKVTDIGSINMASSYLAPKLLAKFTTLAQTTPTDHG